MATSRRARVDELYGLLGDLPDRDRPISCEKACETECESYVLEKLVLDLNGIELVPAYFTRPKKQPAPWPAVLYNHAHGGDYVLGKDELTRGRSLIQNPPYAQALAERGICALCIDTWAFGERRGKTESEVFKEMLWQGRVMWGMMIYDSLRAMDYLVSRPDVVSPRIATLGLSMGSTMAWWTAALDERVKVCVDICCLTDYQALMETRWTDGHGIYYFVPSLLKHFTASDINAMIAPRFHLSVAGNKDVLTPPAGLDRIDAAMKRAYADAGRPEAWKLLRYDVGHMETAAMRSEILKFLDAHL